MMQTHSHTLYDSMNNTLSLDPLPPHARMELIHFYQFLLTQYPPKATPSEPATQSDIAQLALSLFGEQNGIELSLPTRDIYSPLEFNN